MKTSAFYSNLLRADFQKRPCLETFIAYCNVRYGEKFTANLDYQIQGVTLGSYGLVFNAMVDALGSSSSLEHKKSVMDILTAVLNAK